MRRECRERFSLSPTSKETARKLSRHVSQHVCRARAERHVGITNLRWRGKRSRHFRRMRNPQFYVSGKRPIDDISALYLELLRRHWYNSCTIEVILKDKGKLLTIIELIWFPIKGAKIL